MATDKYSSATLYLSSFQLTTRVWLRSNLNSTNINIPVALETNLEQSSGHWMQLLLEFALPRSAGFCTLSKICSKNTRKAEFSPSSNPHLPSWICSGRISFDL